jgi:Trk-type K+ transport system membrane component
MVEQMHDTDIRIRRLQEVGYRPGHARRYMISPGRFGPVLYVIGFLLVGLGGVMLVPALIDLSLNNPDWRTFIAAAVTTVFLGGTLVLANRRDEFHLDLHQGFMLTTMAWLAAVAAGALPFVFAQNALLFSNRCRASRQPARP